MLIGTKTRRLLGFQRIDYCSVFPDCYNKALYHLDVCWQHLIKRGPKTVEEYVKQLIEEIDSKESINGACLQGVDFRGYSINDAVFYKCDLSDACLEGCDAERVYFQKCILKRIRFVGANLRMSIFHDCNITRANFSHATLVDSDLDGSDMSHVVLSEVDWTGSNVKDCTLNFSQLGRSTLVNVRFLLSAFTFSNLETANCEGAVFDYANLRGASLFRTNLTNASFRKADLRDANMQETTCTNTNFLGAKLRSAHLESAKLINAKLSRLALAFAYLKDALVAGFDLNESGLTDADVIQQEDYYVVVRISPPIANPRVSVWLFDYPKYLMADRLTRTGVSRGFEYLIAMLIGGGVACLVAAFQWASPILAFWITFFAFLLAYKYVLPKKIEQRHEALMHIRDKLFMRPNESKFKKK